MCHSAIARAQLRRAPVRAKRFRGGRDSVSYSACRALNVSATGVDAVVGLHRLAVEKLPLRTPSVPK